MVLPYAVWTEFKWVLFLEANIEELFSNTPHGSSM